MRGRTFVSILLLLLASSVPMALAKGPHGNGNGSGPSGGAGILALDGNATLVVSVNATGGDATFGFHAEGEGVPASFALATVNGTASTSFSGLASDGEVELSLDALAGWRTLSASCSMGDADEVTFADNSTTTCWFVVERLGTLHVHVNATGNETFSFAITGPDAPGTLNVTVANGTGSAALSLTPGEEYGIAALPSTGWTLDEAACTGAINLTAGAEAHCWFELSAQTRFRVNVVAEGGDGTFTFMGEGDGVPAWFNITTTDGVGHATFRVDAGDALSATPVVPEGWELASGHCDDVVAAAEDVTACTFTFEKRAQILVTVHTLGDASEEFTLRFSRNGSTSSHEIDVENGWAWRNFSDLDADASYGLRLVVDDDWRVSRSPCGEVDLAPGQVLRCDFVVTLLGEAQGRVTNASTGLGVSAIRVYADVNDDNEYDDGEPSDLTNSTGYYAVEELPLGDVTLRVDVEGSACSVSSPSGGEREVEVTPGSLDTAENFRLACPSSNDGDEDEEEDDDDDDGNDDEESAGGGPGYWKNWRNHHSESQVTAWVRQVDGSSWSMPAGYPATAEGMETMIRDSEGHCVKDLGKGACDELRDEVRELIGRLNELVG